MKWFLAFFVVLLVSKLIVQFGWQVYYVPSSSMRPTLEQGDLLLVNKHSFNLFLPFSRFSTSIGEPNYGDIVVFQQAQKTYVKRVIGKPGDHVRLQSNRLYVNHRPVQQVLQQQLIQWRFFSSEKLSANSALASQLEDVHFNDPSQTMMRLVEGGAEVAVSIAVIEEGGSDTKYQIWLNEDASTMPPQAWQVPADSYFVLGDNRHNSTDSRHFGVVPHSSLQGRLVTLLN